MSRRGAAALAAAAGLARLLRTVPGVAGAVLVVVGFGLAWLPLGFLAAGAFLLLVDARIPAVGAGRPAMVRFPDGRARPVPPPGDGRRLGVVA